MASPHDHAPHDDHDHSHAGGTVALINNAFNNPPPAAKISQLEGRCHGADGRIQRRRHPLPVLWPQGPVPGPIALQQGVVAAASAILLQVVQRIHQVDPSPQMVQHFLQHPTLYTRG